MEFDVRRGRRESFLLAVALLYVLALALDPIRAVRAATLGGKVFLTVVPVMVASFGALGCSGWCWWARSTSSFRFCA